MALPPRELPTSATLGAPVSLRTRSTSAASCAMCSAVPERPSCGLASSARASGYAASSANSRSRGQPFDSKRHSVVSQSAALSPLPCTKTMGGGISSRGGWGLQAAASAAGPSTRHTNTPPLLLQPLHSPHPHFLHLSTPA